MRGPGIPDGRVSRELVGNVDLAPTILEPPAPPPGKTVDGRSLLPFARDPALRTERAMLHETGGRTLRRGARAGRAHEHRAAGAGG